MERFFGLGGSFVSRWLIDYLDNSTIHTFGIDFSRDALIGEMALGIVYTPGRAVSSGSWTRLTVSTTDGSGSFSIAKSELPTGVSSLGRVFMLCDQGSLALSVPNLIVDGTERTVNFRISVDGTVGDEEIGILRHPINNTASSYLVDLIEYKD